MINAEKFRKEILENLNKDPLISVNKHNNEIEECTADNCLKCLFNVMRGNKSCFSAMLRWLLSEYKEPIMLSRLEYELLKYILNHTEYKYIARDRLGAIFIYENKPEKHVDTWRVLANGGGYTNLTIFDGLFKFIKWLDLEPTSIKDVLDNCEVVEDAEE